MSTIGASIPIAAVAFSACWRRSAITVTGLSAAVARRAKSTAASRPSATSTAREQHLPVAGRDGVHRHAVEHPREDDRQRQRVRAHRHHAAQRHDVAAVREAHAGGRLDRAQRRVEATAASDAAAAGAANPSTRWGAGRAAPGAIPDSTRRQRGSTSGAGRGTPAPARHACSASRPPNSNGRAIRAHERPARRRRRARRVDRRSSRPADRSSGQ